MAKTRFTAMLVLLLSLLSILSGCVDRNQLKADVLGAVRKHESVRNYRFSGLLEHEKSSARQEEASSGLWSLIPPEGSFSWQGVASFDPLRAEAEFDITSAGNDPVSIPLFIQNNKMVFRLPGAQLSGHYFSVDLAELAKRNGREETPSLAESGRLFTAALTGFIEAIDAKWFDEPEEQASGRRITVTFGTEQAEEFGKFWLSAWPSVKAALAGYWPEGSGAVDGASSPVSFTLLEPVSFMFDLNEAGFLEQFRADAHVSWQRQDGSTESRRVRLISRLDDINADPPFVRQMPEEAVSFERLLDLLRDGSGGGREPAGASENGAP